MAAAISASSSVTDRVGSTPADGAGAVLLNPRVDAFGVEQVAAGEALHRGADLIGLQADAARTQEAGMP